MPERKPEYPILDIIRNRVSHRNMTGESISHDELMTLFEAARWAPSSFDLQPWRFIYAKKDMKEWSIFFNLLTASNQAWVKNADVLIVFISLKRFEYNNKPSRTHSFDAGAAWENLALQATSMGLVVHSMEGFDYNRAKKELVVPDNFDVECMIALGRPDSKKTEDPTDRKKIQELVFRGRLTP